MTWRIGVSGHIELPPARIDELRGVVEQIFRDTGAALNALHKRDDTAVLFAPATPATTLLSPLAVGADRLVADVAVKYGADLVAPLPFAQQDYRRDFPNDLADFDRLLRDARAKGGAIELDGRYDTEDTKKQAYTAVGEFVVRNCDMLIALWNGLEARGAGGTAHIVDYARGCGVPVVHVLTLEKGIAILGAPGTVPETYSPSALSTLIERQIVPKPPALHSEAGHAADAEEKRKQRQQRATERYFRQEPVSFDEREPLDFLYGGPFAPRMSGALVALSKLFPLFMRLFGPGKAKAEVKKGDPPCGKNEACTRFIFAHHHRADRLATFYANVHRSAFLLVYTLGAAALSCAVAALFLTGRTVPWIDIEAEKLFTGFELVVLAMLGTLVQLDYRFGWRDRWLEYRLLAELLREADLLAQIGRPMPMSRLDEMSEDLPGRAWVRNAYCAIVRASGFVSVKFDAKFLGDLRNYAVETRLPDQVAYHEKAVSRNESMARVLRRVGEFGFWGTIVAAIIKLADHDLAASLWMGFWAGVLPALAYACFGIRNQAEFEIVSRRSERMIAKLERHQQRLKELDGPRLTSGALGREILRAAAVMRHDAADWASIFEVKETEA